MQTQMSVPDKLLRIMSIEYIVFVEYFIYLIAVTTFFVTSLISIKSIANYLMSKGNQHEEIIKIRILFGYTLTYCLALILCGHICRLIYVGSIHVVILIASLIIFMEGLTWFLDMETDRLKKKLSKS
jgi:hypothetical protein